MQDLTVVGNPYLGLMFFYGSRAGRLEYGDDSGIWFGVWFEGMIRGYDSGRSHLLPFEATRHNKQRQTNLEKILKRGRNKLRSPLPSGSDLQ